MATYKRKLGKRDYKELLLTQNDNCPADIMDAVYHNFPLCGNRRQCEDTDPPCYGEHDNMLSLDKMFR